MIDTKMNKTEGRYAALLEMRKQAGEIQDWRYEPLKIKLAEATYYTPDFLVVMADCFEFHEVKGYWRDDARVKIKVAAAKCPWIKFFAVQWIKSAWQMEEIRGGE